MNVVLDSRDIKLPQAQASRTNANYLLSENSIFQTRLTRCVVRIERISSKEPCIWPEHWTAFDKLEKQPENQASLETALRYSRKVANVSLPFEMIRLKIHVSISKSIYGNFVCICSSIFRLHKYVKLERNWMKQRKSIETIL